jgi:hypothetical protein
MLQKLTIPILHGLPDHSPAKPHERAIMSHGQRLPRLTQITQIITQNYSSFCVCLCILCPVMLCLQFEKRAAKIPQNAE